MNIIWSWRLCCATIRSWFLWYTKLSGISVWCISLHLLRDIITLALIYPMLHGFAVHVFGMNHSLVVQLLEVCVECEVCVFWSSSIWIRWSAVVIMMDDIKIVLRCYRLAVRKRIKHFFSLETLIKQCLTFKFRPAVMIHLSGQWTFARIVKNAYRLQFYFVDACVVYHCIFLLTFCVGVPPPFLSY